jgi:hypothetical protein
MPEATPTKRFTATVEIFEITETPESKVYNNAVVPGNKDSRELAKFVVRDPDLEKLKAKLQSHIELVD